MAPGFVLAQLCQIVDLDGAAALPDDPFAAEIYADGEIFVPTVFGAARD